MFIFRNHSKKLLTKRLTHLSIKLILKGFLFRSNLVQYFLKLVQDNGKRFGEKKQFNRRSTRRSTHKCTRCCFWRCIGYKYNPCYRSSVTDVLDHVFDIKPVNVFDNVPEDVLYPVTGNLNNVLDGVPDHIISYISTNVPDNVADKVPDKVPNYVFTFLRNYSTMYQSIYFTTKTMYAPINLADYPTLSLSIYSTLNLTIPIILAPTPFSDSKYHYPIYRFFNRLC